MTETLAAGGLHQIPIDWVSYYHDDARLSTLQPYYSFARSHPELFNLTEAGEVAVLYNEAFEKADTNNYTPGYQGIMMLLADSHRSFDVVFAEIQKIAMVMILLQQKIYLATRLLYYLTHKC